MKFGISKIGNVVWWFGGLEVRWFGGLEVWWFGCNLNLEVGGLVAWWFGGLVVWWLGGLVVCIRPPNTLDA